MCVSIRKFFRFSILILMTYFVFDFNDLMTDDHGKLRQYDLLKHRQHWIQSEMQ